MASMNTIDSRSKRRLILGLALAPASRIALAREKPGLLPMPQLGDDGLYRQAWFQDTFLDLRQDVKEAHAQGRRLAIFWEQRGCPYCKATHQTNLRIPLIVDYLKEKFFVLRLNLWGSLEVTDFDAETLSEKNLARKHAILFTPTIQFFAEPAEAGAGAPAGKTEVFRVPGYFKPFEFYFAFRYVAEKGYEHEPSFQAWLNARGRELRAKGLDVDRMLWSDTLDLGQ